MSRNYKDEIRANPSVENFLTVLWPDTTYMGCGESICSLQLEDQTLRFRLISCEYSTRVQRVHGTYTWKPQPPTVTPEAECAVKAKTAVDRTLGSLEVTAANSPEDDENSPEGDVMSDWSDWSVCKAGVLMKTRTKKCLGSCSSTEPFETLPCPKFSPWTEWSDCVGQALGGPGQAKRTRECLMTPCSPNDVLKELQDCRVPKCGKKDARDAVFCTRMLRDGDCAYSNVREELCVDTCCEWKEGAKNPAPETPASAKTPQTAQMGAARGVQVWSEWGDWGACKEPGRQTRKRTCEGWGCPDALGDYIKDLPAEVALEQDQPCTGPECIPDKQRPEYCAIQKKIGNCKFASVRDRLCQTTCCWITDRLSFYSN